MAETVTKEWHSFMSLAETNANWGSGLEKPILKKTNNTDSRLLCSV